MFPQNKLICMFAIRHLGLTKLKSYWLHDNLMGQGKHVDSGSNRSTSDTLMERHWAYQHAIGFIGSLFEIVYACYKPMTMTSSLPSIFHPLGFSLEFLEDPNRNVGPAGPLDVIVPRHDFLVVIISPPLACSYIGNAWIIWQLAPQSHRNTLGRTVTAMRSPYSVHQLSLFSSKIFVTSLDFEERIVCLKDP